VAHRQVVLTLPKRPRAYFLYDRRRLGLLSRVACRTLRAYVQAAVGLGQRAAVPGLIVCVQTFGSVAHLHPHLHVLMSDGAFRRDGGFVALPVPRRRGARGTVAATGARGVRAHGLARGGRGGGAASSWRALAGSRRRWGASEGERARLRLVVARVRAGRRTAS
jgi:hypothetical protein